MNKIYTVTPVAPGMYNVIDTSSGAVVNRFNIPGELVNGPIISGNSCSIVTKDHGSQYGYTVQLPSGMVLNRFFA